MCMIVCACELWEEVGGTILNGERGILLPKKTRKHGNYWQSW